MNSWTAVHPSIGLVRDLNVLGKLAIFSMVFTHRTLPPGVITAHRHVERLAEQADWVLLPIVFDELKHYGWQREKMSTAWKCFLDTFGQLFTPIMDRHVRNAHLAGHLDNRLAAGLSQPHSFPLTFRCIRLLDFLHDPCPACETVYPKLLLFHKSGSRSYVQNMLTWGMQKADLVGNFFDDCSNPTYGDEIAEAFKEEYNKCSRLEMDPDTIFHKLQALAGGSERGSPTDEAAVLAVLAYLFEQCDIFERPLVEVVL